MGFNSGFKGLNSEDTKINVCISDSFIISYPAYLIWSKI